MLYAILFAEGFVSVSLQILIMRQLIPFVGNSVVTVSVIVSIFLISLSAGYYMGGKVGKDYREKLRLNFIISALIVSFGFSYYAIEMFFDSQIFSNPLISLFVYLGIFLTIPIFLMGQTIPILTNFSKEEKVSKITGGALAINTVGAVLGSLVTSMLFLYFFGVSFTVMLNVTTLMIVGLVISSKKNVSNLIYITSSFMIFLIAYNLNVSYENKKFIVTNHYANYEIRDNSNILVPINRELILNNSLMSVNVNNIYGVAYIEYIKNYLFDFLKLRNKDVLILGAGGFTLTMGLDDEANSNKFKYIDNDPLIKEIVEKYFLSGEVNGELKISDGRVYLKSVDDNYYDTIIVDVFSNRTSIPWQFITVEFMDILKRKTVSGGHIIINAVIERDFSNQFGKRMHTTIIQNLNFCTVSPLIVDNNQEYLNYIYICKNDKYDDISYSDMYDKMSLDEIISSRY